MKMMVVMSKDNISIVKSKNKVNEKENKNREKIDNVDNYYNNNVNIFVLA